MDEANLRETFLLCVFLLAELRIAAIRYTKYSTLYKLSDNKNISIIPC